MNSIPVIKRLTTLTLLAGLALGGASCSALTSDTGSDSGAEASDESDVEAAVTGGVDTINQSINSSASDSAASIASLVTSGTSYATTSSGAAQLRRRFHCEDADDYTESFVCDPDNSTAVRTVTFEDCEVVGTYRDIELNGSFTNTNSHIGADACAVDSDVVDFSKLVVGDGVADPTHEHETSGDGLVFTFTNARGREVTVTQTSSNLITYTGAVDADGNGSAESVTSTIELTNHIEHEIGSVTAHDIDIFTTDTDFTSTDADGAVTDVAVALPTNTLTYNNDGELTSRTITSGNLIVDHNLAKLRVVMGVGADGLTFDTTDDACGPESGTAVITVYEINDDGSIGAVTDTDTITFVDGEPDSASGLDIRPRPCH